MLSKGAPLRQGHAETPGGTRTDASTRARGCGELRAREAAVGGQKQIKLMLRRRRAQPLGLPRSADVIKLSARCCHGLLWSANTFRSSWYRSRPQTAACAGPPTCASSTRMHAEAWSHCSTAVSTCCKKHSDTSLRDCCCIGALCRLRMCSHADHRCTLNG